MEIHSHKSTGGVVGVSVGINIAYWGVMTGMRPNNQMGLMWGRRQAQECGRRAVETTAALIELVEFHTVEL